MRPVDRRFWALIGLGVGAAAVAVAVATSVVPAGSSEPAPTATATSTAAPPAATTTAAPATEQPPASTVPAAEDAQAGQELAGVAAGLTDPVVLTSPAEWDRWAGARPTYPGDRDIDGCPVMAERLGGALGMHFSYWFGTLPQGPYGCYYAPVPLHYDGSSYPYLASVGWLADGANPVMREEFLHHQGRPCPSLDVPAAGEGAVLARCEQPWGIEYGLTVRDARGAGLWVLSAGARDGEAHPAPDVLDALIQGVTANYG